MIGYKATDKNMQCRGYQFTLGEWHELPPDSPLKICESGFHFCENPSGVWEYYNTTDVRVFEVEADCVEDQKPTPGAAHKLVCRRIRFVREITPGGDSNTGNRNTGDRNTGNGNATHYSAGYFCAAEQPVLVFDEPTATPRAVWQEHRESAMATFTCNPERSRRRRLSRA